MHKESRKLMAAVSMAADRRLDVDDPDDSRMMQSGCYILNSWGFGPVYRYPLYIGGPFSKELDEDCEELGDGIGSETDVPEDAVAGLRHIFVKGIEYTEAYSMVLLIMENSPGASDTSIRRRALEVKPHLRAEIEEACSSLLR